MRSVITVVFAATMATACVDELDVGTSTQAVLEQNRIVSNRIVSNRITLNRIVLNRIVSNQISINRYRIVSNELLSTAEGRELLTYVISCAVPTGVTLVGEYGGVDYEFLGEIGLAPRWINRALRRSDQRWVSACLLARVNRFGISVPISIRGPHDALTVTQSEADDYSVEEGAFYGNIFTPVDEPLIWHACRGRDEAAGEGGPLDLRDCAEEDPANPGATLCGFDYVADCADWAAPSNAYACKKFREPHDHCDEGGSNDEYRGGFYEQCHDGPGSGHWPHAERFAEVITVFVTP